MTEMWPDSAGEFLRNMLGGGGREPGPPYIHTFALPQPCPTDCDPDCELNPDGCHERHEVRQARDHDPDECEASRRPGPAYTLTERPVADVVAEAGFGPVPHRIEITADFCQCEACRAERHEP